MANLPDPDDLDDVDDTDDEEVDLPTEQEIDQIVQRGLKAAAKGENVNHLLEVMASLFPEKARETVARKFSKALAQKKLPQPSRNQDVLPRSKLVRIHRMFTRIVQQQAVARVTALMNSKPQTASDVKKQGRKLAVKGVKADKDHLTGADLGTIAPTAAVKPKRDQGKKSGREV